MTDLHGALAAVALYLGRYGYAAVVGALLLEHQQLALDRADRGGRHIAVTGRDFL